jgi:DNA invertase Pin-like site-specific DNA recombinase
MNDLQQTSTKSEVTAAYMRTATADRETTGPSLERQRLACEEYADALGLRVSAVYCDVGVSGLSEQRPALDQPMHDLSRGGIRHVVMADPDRLTRNRQLEQRLQERIRGRGASVSSPCDSRTATDRKEDRCHN